MNKSSAKRAATLAIALRPVESHRSQSYLRAALYGKEDSEINPKSLAPVI
jgi:hypothetical protein